jgi:hypothetical protein
MLLWQGLALVSRCDPVQLSGLHMLALIRQGSVQVTAAEEIEQHPQPAPPTAVCVPNLQQDE